MVDTVPNAVHLIVPELVPREYADHADREENLFEAWSVSHDENQEWLVEVSGCVSLVIPTPFFVQPFGLAGRLRTLANDLLSRAKVLGRDQVCLDRAVFRLINKTR